MVKSKQDLILEKLEEIQASLKRPVGKNGKPLRRKKDHWIYKVLAVIKYIGFGTALYYAKGILKFILDSLERIPI